MDYLKTVVPSQMIAERGANLVVINPGSTNLRIGLANQAAPVSVPHCIARFIKATGEEKPKLTVKDHLLNSEPTLAQNSDRIKAYETVASLLGVPFPNEEHGDYSFTQKMGRINGGNAHSGIKVDNTFTWTHTFEKNETPTSVEGKDIQLEPSEQSKPVDSNESSSKYREFICGEEALKISFGEPYCICRPIRRGHFNVSQEYSAQQVIEDISAIWDWVLTEKLHVYPAERSLYSAVLVVPETFDSREIKEMLSILLRDLKFSSAVVHQEGLAAAFGNGMSTVCIVNMGSQVTSVICIEDGVALPLTTITLPFGGDDISKCLLWIQQCSQSWPKINTDPIGKPVDLLMLNKIKEAYCEFREGECDAVTLVHSYDVNMAVGSHKSRLSALNVPPMGLFYPMLLIPEVYPPPPRSWFHDYDDMLEEIWHIDFPRRPEFPDAIFPGANNGLNIWDNYPVFPTRIKREDKIGLADAITSSILSTGRIELQRRLFCSIQLVGGVALTSGLVAAVEDRVLHAIPSSEAIDTVEVLQSRSDPLFVPWKGGVILGLLDFGRETWIHREDWLQNGIHVASARKYKDSYYLQGQAMSYISS